MRNPVHNLSAHCMITELLVLWFLCTAEERSFRRASQGPISREKLGALVDKLSEPKTKPPAGGARGERTEDDDESLNCDVGSIDAMRRLSLITRSSGKPTPPKLPKKGSVGDVSKQREQIARLSNAKAPRSNRAWPGMWLRGKAKSRFKFKFKFKFKLV